MQVNISGHQLDVTDALRDYIAEKLDRLERHFDKITTVQVTMNVEKLLQKSNARVLRYVRYEVGAGIEKKINEYGKRARDGQHFLLAA